jgi:hypothetical protein
MVWIVTGTPFIHAQDLTSRVSRQLQALYAFDERDGSIVHNRADTGEAFDLTIDAPNKVQWFRGFIVLKNETVLRSISAGQQLTTALRESNELTLEAWVKPASATQAGPARIVSISADPDHRNLTLGQQADAWEVRLRTATTSVNGMPAITSEPGTCRNDLMHVVYTRNKEGTANIYVNGQLEAGLTVAGDLSSWDDGYALLLANEATGDRPWLGELHLVAIYSAALTSAEVQQNFSAGSGDDIPADQLPPAVTRAIDFVTDVQPLLRQHCFECHASGNEEGSLNLGIKARAMEGGEHGPILSPGNSLDSLLIHWVAGIDEGRVMPPEDKPPLTADQVGILRAWIDQGAQWPANTDVLDPKLERAREHWAYQRLQPTIQPPALDTDRWSKNQIDKFIAAKHAEHQLMPAQALPARALARRLYFDLHGLPPSPQQVDGFIAAYNADPVQAVNDCVDRLLDSPHYGERWGRHWLDLVRFAESDGEESDRDRPHAYRYRDFVIHAFNDDFPYDQFVRWQIAGDEIEPHDPEAVAATGFLTAGTQSILEEKYLEAERLFNRYNQLDDVVSTLGTSMLGLTVGCARCHDHKYDAFSARDYYRLMCAFHSGERTDGKLPDGSPGTFFKDYDAHARTTWLFRRSDFYDRELEVRLGFPSLLTSGRDAQHYWDAARQADNAPKNSTLQRRALADWITDIEHGGGALLARVFVNRVWQHHFGQGLVRTESDFGVRSEPPTHPELLEYLAHDFVQHGWKLKRLHRLILGTATWQQGNGPIDAERLATATRIDSENRFLWKMSPQRLEAEVLRDTMLSVSGTLNSEPYGPSFKPYISPEANLARNLKDAYPSDAPDNPETRRRSIYMFHKRLIPYPLFQAFDRPDLMVGCARRQNTTVAPQALAIMNDRFVRTCASDVAKRLINDCGEDDARVVSELFQWAFSRSPNPSEADVSVAFIQSQTKVRESRDEAQARMEAIADYCQSVFGLNEFIYVD